MKAVKFEQYGGIDVLKIEEYSTSGPCGKRGAC